ncbi:MAG TPA: methyl-accepting chemotaxis protein [Candidatus Sulfotelmatobacter sp.]|nr:methyl-accepting chemotaxis protein [Candidatus Sulfotelmatobacter sp.]
MKLKIGSKLTLAFGVILALMVVCGVLSYIQLSTIAEKAESITKMRVPTLDRDRQLQTALQYDASKSRQTILAGTDPARRAKAQESFEAGWVKADHDLAQLEELAPHWSLQLNRDRLAQVKEDMTKLRVLQQRAMDLAASGAHDAIIRGGNDYADNATPLNDQAVKTLGELCDSHEEFLAKDNAALDAANRMTKLTLLVSTLLAAVIGIVVALMLSRGISSATASVLRQAESIAAGDLSIEQAKVTSEDELGELTRAINKMQGSLREVIESIAENAQNVANASEEFSAVSQQISANSEETSAQANAVSSATEQVNRGLQTVASATEEMSASIREIAKNTTEAAKVADSAMKTATETNAIVAKLGESSAEIGQVIKVITSIAQKTDLLALNATVEAARAGEVGAGFAVVANEVKELAKQTAAATEDISRKIETIQADAKGAVEAIASISGVIGQVNSISATIATAVEEQSATTSEMSRNVSEAAKGAGEVAQNIQGVAQAAQSTSHGATDSQKASKNLAEMSTHLRELVGRFKLDDGRRAGRSRTSGKTVEREAVREVREEEFAMK